MSAPITKDQLTFSLGTLSYIDASYDEQAELPAEPRRHPVLTWFRNWRQSRRMAAELALMTDRQLADIGLLRADVSRVFDPRFVAERARNDNASC